MMACDRVNHWLLRGYLLLFLLYLFLPLLIMGAATFNDSRFPTVTPWQGFTWKWFAQLWSDTQMWRALQTSLWIGVGVVALSLPIGVAAALLLGSVRHRARTFIYALMVSPLLTPGVIVGISTLIFWREVFGFSGGIFLSIIAQSTFISAYVMLLVAARLERFDNSLEEAALDLGASHVQVFWRITLPYLSPALWAAAFLAFLQSFENYNTTLFVRGLDTTLTIYIASKVRTGVTPAVNALGLIFIALTILGAVLYEWRRRTLARQHAHAAARAAQAERQLLAEVTD